MDFLFLLFLIFSFFSIFLLFESRGVKLIEEFQGFGTECKGRGSRWVGSLACALLVIRSDPNPTGGNRSTTGRREIVFEFLHQGVLYHRH